MGFEYDRFDIIEVAQRCGIQFHPIQRGGAEFTALCPFCGDTKYHLGLNRAKERFFCFRCKASGNSVTLYAKLHGIGNREAYHVLKGELETMAETMEYHKSTETPLKPKIPLVFQPEFPERCRREIVDSRCRRHRFA